MTVTIEELEKENINEIELSLGRNNEKDYCEITDIDFDIFKNGEFVKTVLTIEEN